ncbi:unnamed protein product [Prunus brigantina]
MLNSDNERASKTCGLYNIVWENRIATPIRQNLFK